MSQPLVVVYRKLWGEIAIQAASASREFGGIIIGRRTRVGSIHCVHQVPLAHTRATTWQVRYDNDEVARARKVAFDVWREKGLEPIGGWHSHPFEVVCAEALMPQLSDEDLKEMQEGDIELVAVNFPHRPPSPDWTQKSLDMLLYKKVGGVDVRLEPWLKRNGEEVPCRITLR